LGLTHDVTRRRLRTVERITALLPDSVETYARWKDLVITNEVKGRQVHDAKLVALMSVYGMTHLLTLNPGDFCPIPTGDHADTRTGDRFRRGDRIEQFTLACGQPRGFSNRG